MSLKVVCVCVCGADVRRRRAAGREACGERGEEEAGKRKEVECQ